LSNSEWLNRSHGKSQKSSWIGEPVPVDFGSILSKNLATSEFMVLSKTRDNEKNSRNLLLDSFTPNLTVFPTSSGKNNQKKRLGAKQKTEFQCPNSAMPSQSHHNTHKKQNLNSSLSHRNTCQKKVTPVSCIPLGCINPKNEANLLL
jgi:hypothetical protein